MAFPRALAPLTAPDVDTEVVLAALAAEALRLGKLAEQRSLAHRRACNWWNGVNYALGLPAAVLAAVGGATVFAHKEVGAILALCGGILAALVASLNPSQTARLHQHASTSYASVGGEFRRFDAIDLVMVDDLGQLRTELDATIKQFNDVDAASPPIPWLARQLHQLNKAPEAGAQA